MTNAIDAVNVTKVYRRYARKKQFATLKSALLNGQPGQRPAARRDVPGAARRVVLRAEGLHLRRHRPQRLGQEHAAQVRGRHHPADDRHGHASTAASRRSSSSAPASTPRSPGRENVFINGIMLGLSKREIQKRFDEIVEFAELQGLHRRAGQDLLVGHVHAARLRRGDPRRPRRAARRRGARRRRPGLHREVPRQVRRVPAPQQDHPARHALARPGREVLRPGAVARQGQDARRRRSEARRRRLYRRRREGRRAATRQGGGRAGRPGRGRRRPRRRTRRSRRTRSRPPRRRPTCSRRPRAAGDRARSR